MRSSFIILAENVFFNACLNESLSEDAEEDAPTNLFVGEPGRIDGVRILTSADFTASNQQTNLLDILRREGIGRVASCRFVVSPLLDEGYPVYPRVISKYHVPWYRRYDKGSR